MDLEHRHRIRDCEIDMVIPWLPKRARVLDIGAGTGRQAKRLADRGFSVEAIDLEDSRYAGQRIRAVTDYDGHNIPFPDACFDVVFSSCVLEHIPHVVGFQKEIQRVLKPDGIAVHVVPNAGWRVWTNVTHYAFLVRFALSVVHGKMAGVKSDSVEVLSDRVARQGYGMLIRKALSPSRHGEKGNVLSEAGYFSRFRWNNLFRSTGWEIVARCPNRLFYTGYSVLGRALSVRSRQALSRVLGSVCHVYVLRPSAGSCRQGS